MIKINYNFHDKTEPPKPAQLPKIIGFCFELLIMIVFILQAIAFLTLLERHFFGGSQYHFGPNKGDI
ncbi:hypothetical protein X798_05498 [Onchocerca flexuosa]|uniref:Uncharacterized protein n=1 Tax=Onchocerca flexuosa TaxID=387005 RepID=A0A238BR85_9BILA|nr:hypothetical protein X798_05498 [Onchocerca flexuosa]